MNWAAECVAIIPCFNEQKAIAEVVSTTRGYLPNVLVVDDGSSDRTAELARSTGAQVLRTEPNRGKGAALQAGWRSGHERGFKWALTMDGDGQHSPADIPSFFRCVEEKSAALVIGDRMGDAATMPWLRRFVNCWMSSRLSRVAGRELPDSQCGFRLMNLETWATLSISTLRFEIESEVLLAFVLAGHRIEFVPIHVIYKGEQSKIHPIRDTIRWFRWWRRLKRTQLVLRKGRSPGT
jgi:glycosyltransferase involved in cell wall biosynthesis